MKKLTIILVAIFCFNTTTAQQKEIRLETEYGTTSKELQEIIRFEGIEIIDLKFSGEGLIGKDYTILIKEFSNGSLAKLDTLVSSKTSSFLKSIDTTVFKFKYFVKTRLNNTIKMTSIFSRFSNTKLYDIKKTDDTYALHDFLGNNKSIVIEIGKPTYILGYFLPYLDKETGWKMYCQVSGSEHNPEDWGIVFNIPNYFLIEVLFE